MRALVWLLGGLAVLGVGWWLWPAREVIVAPPPVVVDAPFIRSTRDEVNADAGVVRVEGTVVDEEKGVALVGVRVRLFVSDPELEALECSVCHQRAIECEDATTARHLLEAIRSGAIKPPATLAETTTDAEGRFVFDSAPVGSVVVAVAPGKKNASTSVEDDAPIVVELAPSETKQILIVDEHDAPLPAARVTLYEPLEGTLKTLVIDAAGHSDVDSADAAAWVFAEADGALPVGRGLAWQHDYVLAAPRVLIAKTVYAGTPVDAELSFELHSQRRTFPTRDGVARIEGLPYGLYFVLAKSGSLTTGERGVELPKPENEVVFDLRQSSTLLVSVISSTGDLLEDVSGSLVGGDVHESKEATNGALLIFGPVPEGDYELSVDAPGTTTARRVLDLPPGETRLELVMNVAPKLNGKVLTADGKPADGVRVAAAENDDESGVSYSDENGEFSIEVPYPGTFQVKCEFAQLGAAEATAKVPGTPVVLRLEEHGVLEARLIDVDGKPLPVDFLVRAKDDGALRWLAESPDGGWGRLAGLPSGDYEVMKEQPGFLPIVRVVSVTDGRTTRLSVQAERGVSISGRVVDERGAPLENAALVTNSKRPDYAMSGKAGAFEITGIAKGPLEFWAVSPTGAESAHVSVDAPARDVVLTVGAALRVRGRVVDEQGVAVSQFQVNTTAVRSGDGRFEVEAPRKSLEFSAEGYVAEYLVEVTDDVGDVVLKRAQSIEGEVVDGDGRAMSGVSVQLTNDAMPTTTDGRGRFKLPISSDDEQDVLAMRGALSGRARAKAGASVRIVLQRGTHVVGRVLGAEGKGIPNSVLISSRDAPRPINLDTDAEGRFEGDVPQGVWVFSARSNRVQRTVEVKGAYMEITLGEDPGSCGFVATADVPIEAMWLFITAPSTDETLWSQAGRTPGSMELFMATARREVTMTGVPCGSYSLIATLRGERATVAVTLRSAMEKIAIPTPVSEPEDVAP